MGLLGTSPLCSLPFLLITGIVLAFVMQSLFQTFIRQGPAQQMAKRVLNKYFGEEHMRNHSVFPTTVNLWFQSTPEYDTELRNEFGEDVEKAKRGEYDDLQQDPHGSLALVVLLDQFPRNIYRKSCVAFESDEKAYSVMMHAINTNQTQSLSAMQISVLYMPFQHREDPGCQQLGCAKVRELLEHPDAKANPGVHQYLTVALKYAVLHQEIVDKFGRFPHRNTVLSREFTPEETEYLKTGETFGQ